MMSSSARRSGSRPRHRLPGRVHLRPHGHGLQHRVPGPMSVAVTIGRHGLDRRSVVAVARDGALVDLGDDAREALAVAAELVARASESAEPVYGVSTGFGSLATTVIPPERRDELQRALIRSHAAGMGPPVEDEVVRAMMLLRARTLAMGYSGVRPVVVEHDRRPAQRRDHAGRPRARLARRERRSRPLAHVRAGADRRGRLGGRGRLGARRIAAARRCGPRKAWR